MHAAVDLGFAHASRASGKPDSMQSGVGRKRGRRLEGTFTHVCDEDVSHIPKNYRGLILRRMNVLAGFESRREGSVRNREGEAIYKNEGQILFAIIAASALPLFDTQ